MKIHITNIYNQLGPAGTSQQQTCKIARELGFSELGIYRYNPNIENDHEMRTRIDGIIASLQWGDIVFIQSPSWNGIRFDSLFIRKIKAYKGVKIAIFIHDVVPLAFDSGEDKLRATIEIYNYADLIIAPSQAMLDLLQKNGLNVKKQMVQEIWDYPLSYELHQPHFYKRMFFTGAPSRFPFILEWKHSTPISLYTGEPFSAEGLNVDLHGYRKETILLSELSEGGYGLVWPSGDSYSYYQLLQPYKVSTYLAAGIPIIMKKGFNPESLILQNGLGFSVDSLEEANEIVQSSTEQEYNQMVQRIAEFNVLVKDGWFTKKMLTDAVMWLLNKNYKP